MTRKIAIIGTSHVSAIVMAWREIGQEYPQIEPVFFATPGKNFRRLQINAKRQFGILDRSLFTPAEIKLLENTFDATSINLGEYDAVINVGLNTFETELADLITTYSVDGLREIPEKPLLSQGAFEALSNGLAHQAVLPEAWQNWQAPPLYVLPAPRVSESCEVSKSAKYASWRALLAEAETAPVAEMFDGYTAGLITAFADEGITFVAPPATTFADSGLSHAQFTKHAPRLKDGRNYPSGDHKHMNVEYGVLVLRHLLETLQEDLGIEAATLDAALSTDG